MIYDPAKPLYGLQLNSVFGRCEERTLVAVSYDTKSLKRYMEEHTADKPYSHEIGVHDKTYILSFKAGSPLMMYNMPYSFEHALISWDSEEVTIAKYRKHITGIIAEKGINNVPSNI